MQYKWMIKKQVYNKFQELVKMSLLQLLQERTGVSELMVKNYMALRALEQQNVLQVLSIALAKSVNSFQQSYQPTPQTPLPTPVAKTLTGQSKDESRRAVIEILSDGEQLSVGNQLKYNFKSGQLRALPTPIPSQKIDMKVEPKGQEINPTSAENQQEQSSRKKKTKPIKKRKQVKQTPYSAVPLPTLDLLEASRLPQFGMGVEEVVAKREALLGRRVRTWGSLLKKQKRELRMLN